MPHHSRSAGDVPPALEPLEQRLLLTTVAWDGGGDGFSWHDPLNWAGNALPGDTDFVQIETGGQETVYHTADAGETSVDGLYSSKALVVTGGHLRVLGDAEVDETLLLDGGTLELSYDTDGAGEVGNRINGDLRIHETATLLLVALADESRPEQRQTPLTITGDVSNAGRIELGDEDAGTGEDAIVTLNVGGLLTNEATGTIETRSSSPGWGDPVPRAINASIDNYGTITTNDHTATTLEGGTFANHDNGTLRVNQPYITHAVAVASIVDGTLTGGTYHIADEWVFDGAEIRANAANLIIDDGYIEDEHWDDALAHLALNTADGTLDITNYTLYLEGSFTNAGHVRLNDYDMHLRGSYTQTAGVTELVDWAGIRPAEAGVVRILGGELTGEGFVAGDLINSGLLRPRDSGSGYDFSVSGDYVQTHEGTLDVALRGYSYPKGWDFDRLEVSGQTTLGGTLKVTADTGYGTAFRIVETDGGPAEWGYCLVDGLESGGWTYRPRRQADGIVLEYVDVSTVAPRAWSELELAGADHVLSSIPLGLSEPVVGSGARDSASYTLLDLGADRLLGGGDDVEIPVTPSYTDGEETLELAPATALGEGAYQLTVHAGASAIRDADGNALDGDRDGAAGEDYVLTFVVDTTAPGAVGDAAFAEDWGVSDADGLTGDDELEFSWTPPADEGGIARYEYQYDGGAWHWTLAPAAVIEPSDGEHTVAVRAVDIAGNAGPEVSIQVTVETTGPAIVTHSPQGTVPSVDHVDVTFTEPVDLATFTPSDVRQDVLEHVEMYTTSAENTGLGQGYDVEVAGSLVYSSMQVGFKTYFQVLDMSTPGATQVVWSLVSSGDLVDLEVVGSTAYFAYRDYGRIDIYDVSDPSEADWLGNYAPGGTFQINDVEIAGSLAYLAVENEGLVIVDVSSPGSTARVGSFPCTAMDVAVSGSLAYVADASDSTLKIIDVSTPSAPTLAGTLDALPRTPLSVQVADTRVYLAMERDGLWIVDAATPSAPSLLGQYDPEFYVYDIEVAGRYAYLTGGRRIDIVDVLVPSAPGRVDWVETIPDYFGVNDVAVDGSDIYLAGGKKYYSGGWWYGVGCVEHASVGPLLDIRGVSDLGGNTYRLEIGESPEEATYSLRIGPDVRDLAGNPMDQNRNGHNGETWDDRDTYFVDLVVNEITLGPVRDLACSVEDSNFVFTWTEPAEAPGLAGYEYTWDGGGWNPVAETTVTLPVTDGTHTFTVRATDTQGSGGPAVSTEVADAMAPSAPTDLAFTPDTGISDEDRLTSENELAFTWSPSSDASGIARYEYRWDSDGWTSVGGQASAEIVALEGAHTFAVRAVDGAGNAGGASSLDLTVDLTGPQILSHSPAGTPESIDHVDVTFDEAIDPGTFTADDVSMPAVEWVDAHGLTAGADDVTAANGLVYLVDDRGAEGLHFTILDFSAPSGPVVIGSCPVSFRASDIEVAGSHAYVAADYSGVQVIDVSDPSDPRWAGEFLWGGAQFRGLEAVGSRLYVAAYSYVLILDISTPASPRQLDGYSGNAGGQLHDVAVAGSLAFLANQSVGELDIMDVSTPSSINLVKRYSLGYQVRAVEAVGSTVYVGTAGDGLWILDVSDPAAPSLVGKYDAPDAKNLYDVDVVGSVAYLTSNGNDGSFVVDVSDPASPRLLERYGTEDMQVLDVAVDGADIFLSEHNATSGTYLVTHLDELARPQVGDISHVADNTYRIDLSGALPNRTYSLWIGPSVGDLAGNAMDQDENGTNGEEADAYEVTFTIDKPVPGSVRDLGYVVEAGYVLSWAEPTELNGLVGYEYRWDLYPWTFTAETTVTLPITDGPHTFTVRAIDDVGNLGEASSIGVADVTPPSPPPGLSMADDTGDSSSDRLTRDDELDFTWGESADASGIAGYEYQWDDGAWEPAAGMAATLPAPEGEHTFAVRAVDNAENAGEGATLAVMVDRTAPSKVTGLVMTNDTGTSPDDGLTHETRPAFSWTAATDANGIWRHQYGLDGEGWWGDVYGTSVQLWYTDPGPHTLEIRAVDRAGNTGQAESIDFTIDTTGLQIVAHDPDGTVTSIDHIDVIFSGEIDPATFTVDDVRTQNPRLVSSYAADGEVDDWYLDMVAAGPLVYVTAEIDDEYTLLIVDMSAPSGPELICSYALPNEAYDLAVAGSYAYVACYGDLVILDVSTPSAPVWAGEYNTASGNEVECVEVVDSLAYLGVYNEGLVVLDVSTPSAPTQVGSSPCRPVSLAVDGSLVFVADGGERVVRIIDASTPSAPSLVRTINVGAWVDDLKVAGSQLYLATGSDGLWVMDVSTPSSPSLLGKFSLPDTSSFADVEIAGALVYVMDDSYDRLHVVDVSTPASPALLGTYDPGRYDLEVGAVAVSDSAVYAFESDYYDYYRVSQFRPTGPVEVAAISHVADNTYRLELASGLPIDSYAVKIGPDVRDIAGNLMDQNEDGYNGRAKDVYEASFTVQKPAPGPVRDLHYVIDAGYALSWAEPTEPHDLVGYEYTWDGGEWVFVSETSVTLPIEDGPHTFAVRATDDVGNTSEDSSIGVPDVVAPPETTGLAMAEDTGAFPDDGLTNDDELVFTWDQTPDASGIGRYEYQWAGDDWASAAEATVTVSASEGVHTFAVRAVDGAGNVGDASSVEATVDLTPPAILDHSPKGLVLEPIDHVDVTFDDAIDPSSFTTDDLALIGPGGPVADAGLSITPLEDNAYRIGFNPQAAGGVYHVAISNEIDDLAGNRMAEGYEAGFEQTRADLEVRDLAATSASPGGDVQVSWRTLNTGVDPAAESWSDGIYLSSDAIWSGDDLLLASVPGGPLAGLGEYPRSETVALPMRDAYGFLLVRADHGNAQPETREDNNDASTALAIDWPDLAVDPDRTQAPASASPQETIQVSWTVQNTGPGWARAMWTDRIYLSDDADVSPDDTELHSLAVAGVSPLSPGGDYQRAASVTIPGDRASGDCYLLVVTDSGGQQPEGNEQNNTFAQAMEISAPDLQVTLDYSPPDARAGQARNFRWTVTNTGEGSTAGQTWVDNVYLSFNEELGQDYLVGSFPAPMGLAAHDSYGRDVPVTIPGDLVGRYYVFVVTDADDQVAEYNDTGDAEGNNTNEEDPPTIRVDPPPQPDLTATFTDTPAGAVSGSAFSVTWAVQNTGEVKTTEGSWFDEIYLSTDTVLQKKSDVRLKSFRHEGDLDPLTGSYSPTEDLALPVGISGGYYLLLLADSENRVYEGNQERDNLAAAPLEVTLQPSPDLVVSVEAPDGVAGETVEVTWTATNSGTGAMAGLWQDRIHLSLDDQLSAEDIYLAAVTTSGSLDPGGSTPPRGLAVTLPDWVEGDYHVLVWTDSVNQIAEYGPLAESNNVGSDPLHITRRPADLKVTEIIPPQGAHSGQRVEVSWKVKNVGAGAAGRKLPQWRDRVYFSTDDSLDEGEDTLVGDIAHLGRLAPNEVYVGSCSLDLADGIEGTFYLFVRTDADNDVYEGDGEDNNTFPVPPEAPASFEVELAPPPDLQVDTVALAMEPEWSGQLMSVTWTVANRGPGPTVSDSWQDAVYLSADTSFDPAQDTHLGSLLHFGALGTTEGVDDRYSRTATFTVPADLEGTYYVLVVADERNDVYEHAAEGNNVSDAAPQIDVAVPAYDLAVTNVRTSGEPWSGRPVTVLWDVTNAADAPMPVGLDSWYDSVYLSTDTEFDPDEDTRLGSWSRHGTLGAHEGYPADRVVSLPNGIEGRHYLFVRVGEPCPCVEGDEQNNVAFAAIDVSLTPSANLVVAAEAPSEGWSGQDVTVSWTVTNAGPGATSLSYWLDTVALSADAEIGSDLVTVNVWHDEALEPSGDYRESVTFSLPASISGSYYVVVAADRDGYVWENEPGEDDNVAALPIEVHFAGSPDLRVTSVNADRIAWSGQDITIGWQVTNKGSAAAGPDAWVDRVYLSQDGQLDEESDLFFGQVIHRGLLPADRSYPASHTAAAPHGVEGSYTVFVVTDAADEVLEFQAEGNNVRSFAAEINLTPPPDLETSDVEVVWPGDPPQEILAGQTITLAWKVTNAGGGATKRSLWQDAAYLSLDTALDKETDQYLGYLEHQGMLGPGDDYTAEEAFRLPTGFAGDYYVLLSTDSTNALFEHTAEGNNVAFAAAPLHIVLPGAVDLVVTDAQVPLSANPGRPATVSYTVLNDSGAATVGGWWDSLYLSTDEQWDLSDTFVTTVQHTAALPAGQSRSITRTFDLPGVVPGDYYLIVRSDTYNQIVELAAGGEGNNVFTSATTIHVDVAELPPGAVVSGTLRSADRSDLYRVELPAEKNLWLTLDASAEAGSNEIYAALGRIPTRSDYDYVVSKRSPDVELVVPGTDTACTYYVLVYAAQIDGDSVGYDLYAATAGLKLFEVSPNRHGTSVDTVMMLTGAGFDPETVAALVAADGTAYPAVETEWRSRGQMTARWAAETVPPGLYAVRATVPGGESSELPDAFEMVEGGVVSIETRLIVPQKVGYHLAATIFIDCVNTGLVTAPAPLLVFGAYQLGNRGAFLTLEESLGGRDLSAGALPEGYRYALQVLVSGQTSGLLQPGERARIPVYYCGWEKPWAMGYPLIVFTVSEAKDLPEPVDWLEVEDQIRPGGVAREVWDAWFGKLTEQVGPTWDLYLASVRQNALRMEQLGQRTHDVRDLFYVELQRAMVGGGASIIGRVANADRPAAFMKGIEVVARNTDGSGAVRATTLDADGRFVTPLLPPGTYELAVEGNWYLAEPVQVTLGYHEDLYGVELAVREGASVHGQVTDAALSWPAAGAAVVATNIETDHSATAFVDEDGHYEILGLPAGTYDVRASLPGTVQQSVEGLALAAGDEARGVDFALASAGAVAGTITDATTGDPIAGVTVVAEAADVGSLAATTDEGGRYVVRRLASGEWTLSAVSTTHLSPEPATLTVAAPAVVTWDVQLAAGGAVAGTVTDGAGAGVEGAYVEAVPDDPDGTGTSTETDESGAYHLGPLAEGTYTITVASGSHQAASTAGVAVVPGRTVEDTDFALADGLAVEGTVTEVDGTTPVAGASVVLVTEAGDSLASAADGGGAFAVRSLFPGVYRLEVSAPGYAVSRRMVAVDEGAGPVTVDVVLQVGADIEGTVNEPDGATPVKGVYVELRDASAVALAAAMTDADGRYRFEGVRDGAYALHVLHEELAWASQPAIVVGGQSVVIDFAAGSEVLSGAVTSSATGQPVAGAVATLHPTGALESQLAARAAEADDLGHYELLNLLPGSYLLVVAAEGLARSVREVTIAGGVPAVADASLSDAAPVDGTVKELGTGSPVAGAILVARPLGAAEADPGVWAVSDAGGGFQLDGLSAGVYRLTALADAYALAEQDVIVTAGGASPAVELSAVGSVVHVSVSQAATGLALPGALVTLKKGGLVVASAVADAVGEVHFSAIAQAEYELAVTYPGATHRQTVSVFSATENVSTSLTVGDVPGGMAIASSSVPLGEGEGPAGWLGEALTPFEKLLTDEAAGEMGADTLLPMAHFRPIIERWRPQVKPPPMPLCTCVWINSRSIMEWREELLDGGPFHPGYHQVRADLDDMWRLQMEGNNLELRYDTVYAKMVQYAEQTAWNALSVIKSLLGIEFLGFLRDGMKINPLFVVRLKKKVYAVVKVLENAFVNHSGSLPRLSWEEILPVAQDLAGILGDIGEELGDSCLKKFPIVGTVLSAITMCVGAVQHVRLQMEAMDEIVDPYIDKRIVFDELFDNGSPVDINTYIEDLDHFSIYCQYTEEELGQPELLLPTDLVDLSHCKKPPDDTGPGPEPEPWPDEGPQPPEPPVYPPEPEAAEAVGSMDPNDKLAPLGYGEQHFVAAGEALAYQVRFENKPDAKAPAQKVIVIDTLDDDLDLFRFELEELAFSNHVIHVPAGRAYHKATVDLRPEGGEILVDVEASLNLGTRELTVTYTAIDPETGWIPNDVTVGLLPPNDEAGSGEGYVSYLVAPEVGLPTGTEIENEARIFFDENEPIDTPRVANVIDGAPPTSAVEPLPALTATEGFLVTWGGSDDAEGAGLASYDVYVSTDDGPYERWLRRTTETSATFEGELDRTYAFYSRARDNVGHVEDAPAQPDATTSTGPPAPPVVLAVERNGGADLWDRVHSLAFTFSTNVTVAPDALSVQNRMTGAEVALPPDLSVQYHQETHTASWDLTGLELPYANYLVRLSATVVLDAAGQLLDGDEDGTGGDDYGFSLIVAYAGDADLDGTVSAEDFAALRSNFGTAAGAAWGDGDFDANDRVDYLDYLLIKRNCGNGIDLDLPTVAAVKVNDGAGRRHEAHALAFLFSLDVVVAPDALTLWNDRTGETIDVPPDVPFEYRQDTGTARWGISDLSLPLGRYTAVLSGQDIATSTGARLDGDGDGIGGGDYRFSLVVTYPGDANLDGIVDDADYLALKRHVGTASGATWAHGDFDGDGDVDRADLLSLRSHLGMSIDDLPAPAAAGGDAAPAAPAALPASSEGIFEQADTPSRDEDLPIDALAVPRPRATSPKGRARLPSPTSIPLLNLRRWPAGTRGRRPARVPLRRLAWEATRHAPWPLRARRLGDDPLDVLGLPSLSGPSLRPLSNRGAL